MHSARGRAMMKARDVRRHYLWTTTTRIKCVSRLPGSSILTVRRWIPTMEELFPILLSRRLKEKILQSMATDPYPQFSICRRPHRWSYQINGYSRQLTGPVNLGNPVEITIGSLAGMIIKMTGSKIKDRLSSSSTGWSETAEARYLSCLKRIRLVSQNWCRNRAGEDGGIFQGHFEEVKGRRGDVVKPWILFVFHDSDPKPPKGA